MIILTRHFGKLSPPAEGRQADIIVNIPTNTSTSFSMFPELPFSGRSEKCAGSFATIVSWSQPFFLRHASARYVLKGQLLSEKLSPTVSSSKLRFYNRQCSKCLSNFAKILYHCGRWKAETQPGRPFTHKVQQKVGHILPKAL